MTDDELKARLAWSRKQMLQRKNKPMAKHANEVFGVGPVESRDDARSGQCVMANSEAVPGIREAEPTPKEISDVFAEILDGQEPLPPEFAKVWEDNAWSLYER